MKATKFDERQVLERGKVFFHGIIAAIILLLGNAVLQDSGKIWASGFIQNITILFAIITVITVEMVFRDVYFGYGKPNRELLMTLIFGICALIIFGFALKDLGSGEALIVNGTFTEKGEHLPYAVLSLIIAVSLAIKAIRKPRSTEE